MVILKGASGKAKRVLVEEILSSGPYLIVQTLGCLCKMPRQQVKIDVFSLQDVICNNATIVNTVLLYLKFGRE